LLKIPYGNTLSYRQLAINVKSPKAFRAVGSANKKNIFPIIIPCHRVIQTTGEIGGYAGGIDFKKYLLELEQKRPLPGPHSYSE
jgi:methylated-DNA-[protein]-cysteine S-methyltransferase